MSKAKLYKSGVKAAIYEIANSLHDVAMIDRQTMRRFDESCLTPVHEFSPEEIRALREREEVSQIVFAHYRTRQELRSRQTVPLELSVEISRVLICFGPLGTG
jgi:DNA-binding transcriptional regulator YiaG